MQRKGTRRAVSETRPEFHWLGMNPEALGFGVGQAEGYGNPGGICMALLVVGIHDNPATVLVHHIVPGVPDDGNVKKVVTIFFLDDLRGRLGSGGLVAL